MTSLEEAMGRVEQRAADMEALIAKRPDAWDDAVAIADDLRTLLTALRSRPTREEVARAWIGAKTKLPLIASEMRAAQRVLSLFTNGTTDQTPMEDR